MCCGWDNFSFSHFHVGRLRKFGVGFGLVFMFLIEVTVIYTSICFQVQEQL